MISNQALKQQLERWRAQIDEAIDCRIANDRFRLILDFCKTFVPLDVNDDDTDHYAQNLANDEVFIINII
jgi:hypothetical protein